MNKYTGEVRIFKVKKKNIIFTDIAVIFNDKVVFWREDVEIKDLGKFNE